MRYRTTVPCHAEPQGFRFRYTPGTGRVSFSTEDDVRISLGNVSAGGPLAYLADPDRIVRASWPSDGDESPVQVEGPGRYVLPMPAVHLLGLTWQARVRWRASFDAEAGALRISSDGVDLGLTGPAADAFRDAFEMAIGGRVKDISEGNDGELSATIRMDVRGRLPPPLTILFPESALREASAEVVRLTQGFAIKELRSRIAADYKAWASRS